MSASSFSMTGLRETKVADAAFKAAVDKELPLKTWLEGNSWRGVDRAHARLLRKLREARSWEAMTNTVLKAKHASKGGSIYWSN